MLLSARRVAVVGFVLACLVQRANAVAVSFEATDNATVQPAGPRTGSGGKAFFNMEGSTAGGTTFNSFAVADFNFSTLSPPLGGTVSAVSGVTLKLTQNNAAFSATGPISFYYTDQTAVDIQPTNTTLNYIAGMDGAAAVDTDLGTLTLLGTGTYTNAGTGMNPVDSYALTLPTAANAALIAALNGGTKYRLVVTADTAATAATYVGFSFTPSGTNPPLAGPTLEFDATVAGGAIDANFDGVGVVDGNDYLIWQRNLGATGQPDKSTGDSDGDHDVDATDFANWKSHYGLAAGVPAIGAVPEPNSLLLTLGAIGCLVHARRSVR